VALPAELLRDGAHLRALNRSLGEVLAARVRVAAGPWNRARGLLGCPALEPDQGLLIVPCRGVHTFGMAYPIDVVHLDRTGLVRAVVRRLKPWRIGPLVWHADLALELPADAARASVGDRLALDPVDA
jgi:uncharacterized protein